MGRLLIEMLVVDAPRRAYSDGCAERFEALAKGYCLNVGRSESVAANSPSAENRETNAGGLR